MPRTIALSLAVLCSSQAAVAATAAAELAEQFVVLLRYDELYTKYQEQCIATQRSVSPESLVERNPNYFGGLRPGHAKWPAIIEAYGKYFQLACARPTREEFVQSLSTAYAKTLSPKQLREAIAFYTTGTGSALVVAHRQATEAVYETWTTINSRYLADLNAKFQREVASLAASR